MFAMRVRSFCLFLPHISPISLMSPLSLIHSTFFVFFIIIFFYLSPSLCCGSLSLHVAAGWICLWGQPTLSAFILTWLFAGNCSWNHQALRFTHPPLPCSSVSLEVPRIMRGGGCPALWLNPHSLPPLTPQREARRRQGKREVVKKEKWVFCSWHSTKNMHCRWKAYDSIKRALWWLPNQAVGGKEERREGLESIRRPRLNPSGQGLKWHAGSKLFFYIGS